jgi:hypothetical protein
VTSHAYRSVVINGEEAGRLRRVEWLLRQLEDAVGDGAYSVLADDVAIIARRYELAVSTLEVLSENASVTLTSVSGVDGSSVRSLGSRRRLHAIDGGSAA